MKHSSVNKITAIVPAAGIGSRMSSSIPKQYLPIGSKTVLEHTLSILVSHPAVSHVVVALNKNDTHFDHLAIASHHKIARIYGLLSKTKKPWPFLKMTGLYLCLRGLF